MKAVLKSLTEIPEQFREHYVEQDGQFVLKVEGDHPTVTGIVTEANKNVAEFRTNNINLMKQREDLLAKLTAFDGVDPGEYKVLKAQVADLKTKGVSKGDDVQTIINAALAPVLDQLSKMQKGEAEAKAALARKNLEGMLTSAGIRAGVSESALPDFLSRGLSTFVAESDGRIVAKKGDTPVYSTKRPGTPLDVEEFASNLQTEAPHLFKPSKGAGAGGSSGLSGVDAPRVISSDPMEFGRNLEDIAKGKVIVDRSLPVPSR